MPIPIAIDLFAGAGGLSLGVEQAGFDVVAAVEIDPVHCAAHKFNFPDCAVVCASVVNLTGQDIRDAAQIGDSDIDLVVGGPPCQGVSMMGYRVLDDPRNQLMLHFVRLVSELRPKYFIMENVKGLTIGPHRQILDEVIATFEANGFDVERKYQVLNAASFGVPQDRQRVFLYGCQRGLKLPAYPTATTWPAGKPQSKAAETDLSPSPTVADALGDLPDVDSSEELIASDCTITELGRPSPYAALLRTFPEPGNWAHPRLVVQNLLTSSMRTIH